MGSSRQNEIDRLHRQEAMNRGFDRKAHAVAAALGQIQDKKRYKVAMTIRTFTEGELGIETVYYEIKVGRAVDMVHETTITFRGKEVFVQCKTYGEDEEVNTYESGAWEDLLEAIHKDVVSGKRRSVPAP